MKFTKGFGIGSNLFSLCSGSLEGNVPRGKIRASFRRAAAFGALMIFTSWIQACDYTIKNRDVGAASGAVIGGGVGAAVGNAVGSAPAGLALGAVTGGLVGGIMGDSQDVKPVDSVGQEAVLKRQEEEFERQRKEIEDLRRQRIYDDRFDDLAQGRRDDRY